MKIYLLKVENMLIIPESYILRQLTQHQGSKGYSATSDERGGGAQFDDFWAMELGCCVNNLTIINSFTN
jgi:hypothetical protein